MTVHTLRSLMYALKQKALHAGKYPPPYTEHHYDKRDKSKAFRSISYNETVRQINALAEVIRFIEQNAKADSSAVAD